MSTATLPTSVQYGDAVVCLQGRFPLRRILHCPTCNQRRRFAGVDLNAWYDAIWTCCGCGDQWSSDGERMERPFRPRWRKQNIAEARNTWDDAGRYSRADHQEWVRAQFAEVSA